MTARSLLLLATAGCVPISVTPSGPTVPVTTSIPSAVPTATGPVCETFTSARDRADVLLVVDNSCSMADEQAAIAENTDLVLDTPFSADLDYHVGLVTTDLSNPREQGQLHEIDGARWIDPTNPDPLGALAALVQVGISGSGMEQGFGAIHEALETHRAGANQGFLRDEAQLAVIVISDEPDFTPTEVVAKAAFVDWFVALKADPLDATVHGAVDPRRADDYLALIELVGGEQLDVSKGHTRAEWDAFFGAALGGVHARAGVLLAAPPDPATIVVGTTDAAGIEVVLDPADYVFVPETNRVRFVPGAVAPGLTVWVEYAPL